MRLEVELNSKGWLFGKQRHPLCVCFLCVCVEFSPYASGTECWHLAARWNQQTRVASLHPCFSHEKFLNLYQAFCVLYRRLVVWTFEVFVALSNGRRKAKTFFLSILCLIDEPPMEQTQSARPCLFISEIASRPLLLFLSTPREMQWDFTSSFPPASFS